MILVNGHRSEEEGIIRTDLQSTTTAFNNTEIEFRLHCKIVFFYSVSDLTSNFKRVMKDKSITISLLLQSLLLHLQE
jgi:hypothetical protein